MIDPVLTRCAAFAAVCVVSLLAMADGARAQTSVVEQMIAQTNPCSALQMAQSGLVIGLDRLDSVSLRRVSLVLEGDRMKADLDGRLACRTSGAAVVQGSAAADIRASASLRMADCTVESLSLDLSGFAGQFGPAIELFEPVIVEDLTSRARTELLSICRALSVESR